MLMIGAALALASSLAAAQGYGPGYGYGQGRGMMGGGYGAGMMGGPGMGGYGPGMMGGGYGPGMMGGYGAGGMFAALNLSDEQREKVLKIQEENRRKNWDLMGQVRTEQFKLRQMAYGDKLDAAAITEQQKKVDDLRRQMLKSRIEARNQVAAVLTAEQKQQFRQFGPWWLEDSD